MAGIKEIHKIVRKFRSGSTQKNEKNTLFCSFKYAKSQFQVGSPAHLILFHYVLLIIARLLLQLCGAFFTICVTFYCCHYVLFYRFLKVLGSDDVNRLLSSLE